MNSLSLLNFTLYQKENAYPEFSFLGSIENITITCEVNQYSRKISLTSWFSKTYVITFFSRNYDKFHVESNNYYMELYFPWTVGRSTSNINIDDYNDLIKNFKFNEFICEHLDEILSKVVSERKDINNKVISIAYEI